MKQFLPIHSPVHIHPFTHSLNPLPSPHPFTHSLNPLPSSHPFTHSLNPFPSPHSSIHSLTHSLTPLPSPHPSIHSLTPQSTSIHSLTHSIFSYNLSRRHHLIWQAVKADNIEWKEVVWLMVICIYVIILIFCIYLFVFLFCDYKYLYYVLRCSMSNMSMYSIFVVFVCHTVIPITLVWIWSRTVREYGYLCVTLSSKRLVESLCLFVCLFVFRVSSTAGMSPRRRIRPRGGTTAFSVVSTALFHTRQANNVFNPLNIVVLNAPYRRTFTCIKNVKSGQIHLVVYLYPFKPYQPTQ